MNKIQLRGRVGADPEIRTLNGGGKVATFRLATEESWLSDGERKKRTTWHIVETFRPADIKVVEATVRKGDLIRVDGTCARRTTPTRTASSATPPRWSPPSGSTGSTSIPGATPGARQATRAEAPSPPWKPGGVFSRPWRPRWPFRRWAWQ